MAAVTQIVPQFSFPYVETYINDYTVTTEDSNSTVVADPAIGYIFAFGSDVGIDNRWVLKRTQASWVKTFGKPDFKKYGQPALTPYVLLGSAGVKVWCMRVMPDNATRAHAITSLYYKADGADVQEASKRKFRIKYTARYVDPKGASPIITKNDLLKVRGQLDGAAHDGVYKDGEGYTQVPGIVLLSSNGRGSGGNNQSVRIANNVYYEKEYGIKIYGFEILSTDRGLIKDADYTGSIVTSVKYDSATLINDILIDTEDGIAPVDIDVDEECVETVYNAYIEFCKKQYNDLAEELEKKMTEKSVTQGMMDGTEEVPEDKAAAVAECIEIRNMRITCAEDMLPALDGFDPIFGLTVGSTSSYIPFLQFPEKLTDEVDTGAEDYVAADYTQTDIISFDDVRGVVLKGGTNGYFDNPRTEVIENKLGEKETIQWTVEDEMTDCYKRAWNGTLDKRILTAKRIGCSALFDANYPYEVKCEMAKLTLARKNELFYMDTGIRGSYGADEVASMISQYSIFASRQISKNLHHFYTKDPITKKRIPVTITFFLANRFWKHMVDNGMHIPMTKGNCQLSGHVRNSLAPTIEDYDVQLKEMFQQNRFNYFETIEDNVYQRATQNTSQEANSDLLEESNVMILYEAKRIVEKDINDRLYRFNEAEERSEFRQIERAKFNNWNNRLVQSFDIKFKANKWELERSIIHCYIEIVFRGIYKRGIVEIDINRRDYAAMEDAADTDATGVANV